MENGTPDASRLPDVAAAFASIANALNVATRPLEAAMGFAPTGPEDRARFARDFKSYVASHPDVPLQVGYNLMHVMQGWRERVTIDDPLCLVYWTCFLHEIEPIPLLTEGALYEAAWTRALDAAHFAQAYVVRCEAVLSQLAARKGVQA